ncbi:MAG TPA: ribonuclease H-like domain-containing protein [Candidatus Limnocylindrales bacterium]|nr:ribonuclease H-like domain-containing protein [Candidatus Limnocylindrales bacterium]
MPSAVDKFSRLAALKPARALPQKLPSLRMPNEEDPVSRLLGGGIATNRFGEHLAIRNWFSTPEFVPPSPVALQLLSRPRDDSVSRRTLKALENPEKWLFLDTETTGLAGGTGTYAFLVGIAWWDAGGLQVEQLFLRDFSEEHSLLHELAQRLAERPVLVTFNGKCFDWPLLENRFTMTRAIRVPQLQAHLDLLHPARALWRLRLGSVRLTELERHVLDATRLGWQRADDVPSALIPQLYFDYLRGGTAKPLVGVVKHNQMDLRGLAALFGKINSLLEAGERSFAGADSLDLFGLSKFLNRRGEKDLAQSACAQALNAGLPTEFRPQATRDLALMAKRRGDAARAAELWHELVAHPQDSVLACEQLAIHYERHARDLARALEFAQLAIKQVQTLTARTRDLYAAARAGRQERKLLCRLERLRHRIARDQAAIRAPVLAHSAVAASGSRQRTR